MDLKDKKVTVIGLGVSGKAAASFLLKQGASVYVTDCSSSEAAESIAASLKNLGAIVETGKHTEDFIKGSELIIVSPGVPDTSDALLIAAKNSIPVISEIELASRFCQAPIIAVTGTNGKSTTVTLIGLILEASGKKPIVCGNIGEAFCDKLDEIGPDNIVVLEVSSFQLKRIRNFRPKVAAITNITQNHFDWHTDFNDYFACKNRIYENQKEDDLLVLNYDDKNLSGLNKKAVSAAYFFSRDKKARGAYCENGALIIDTDGNRKNICNINNNNLKGTHNISNILCAFLCCYFFGATGQALKNVLSEFRGLKHRFQDVTNLDGVRYIDDSKSTTVDSTAAALASCAPGVILIAGGRDKGSDFTKIKQIVSDKVKTLVLIGEARKKIKGSLDGACEIFEADGMDEAVLLSRERAGSGDIVLLSPMCASFDMYKNYAERGDFFVKAVERLKLKGQTSKGKSQKYNSKVKSKDSAEEALTFEL